MRKKFKIGDRVICPNIDIITEIHDQCWPNDANRDAYIEDLKEMVGKVYTIDDMWARTTRGGMQTYGLSFEEQDSKISHWVKPQEMFELYYESNDDNILPIFGSMTYEVRDNAN